MGEGKAESVLAVLAARGIRTGKKQRERILGCGDLDTLDHWLAPHRRHHYRRRDLRRERPIPPHLNR
jgi:hypothetical protein